jgi:hypothetical protein
VGPKAGLDTEDRGKILWPCRGSNPDRPVVQAVVIDTILPELTRLLYAESTATYSRLVTLKRKVTSITMLKSTTYFTLISIGTITKCQFIA